MNQPHYIQIKRVYDPFATEDGYRVLVDGMWPRGISKQQAGVHAWYKQLAPSQSLRKWYAHDRSRWRDFFHYYTLELQNRYAIMSQLLTEASEYNTLTLLYAAKDRICNNAVVLKEFLETTYR